MPLQTHVFRRGRIYYHRLRIPKDLLSIFSSAELRHSLRTADPSQAKRLGRRASELADCVFEGVRMARLPGQEARALLRRLYDELLDADEDARIDAGSGQRARIHRRAGRIMAPAALRSTINALNIGELGSVESEAAVISDLMGAGGDMSDRRYRELCYHILHVYREARQRIIGRDAGNYGGEPGLGWLRDTQPAVLEELAEGEGAASPATHSGKPAPSTAYLHPLAGPSFGELADLFLNERSAGKDRSSGTWNKYEQEFRDSLSWFEEFVDPKMPGQITNSDVVEYKNALLKLPKNYKKFFKGSSIKEAIALNATAGRETLSVKSINTKRLAQVDLLYDWACRNSYLTENPVNGLRGDVAKHERKAKQRDPFTSDELQRLFESPHFTGCASSADWKRPGPYLIRDHRYWLPLLALWTGARQSELAQLNTTDLFQQDGVWAVRISELNDDGTVASSKSVKNQESRRIIPIHPELIRLGFLDYCRVQQAGGSEVLFPDCRRGADGTFSPFSKHFKRFLDHCGVSRSGRLVFHSFRHSFEDAMREAGLEDSVRFALAGRTMRHSSEIYGSGYSLSRLHAAISKVRFSGLSLCHLYPAEEDDREAA